MNSTTENNMIIDAVTYKRMLINSAATIENNCVKLNDLNVFPVPDGDTGSNMSLTIMSAAKELKFYEPSSVGEVTDKAAKAMLRGARGNSGVITSLLFRGMANELKGVEMCDSEALANALQAGVAAAYQAVAKPAEGTILTVSRLGADAAVKAAQAGRTPIEVFEDTISSAKAALEQTMEMNPTLKKAGVVDAGGYGWVLILEAMRDALNGIEIQANIGEITIQESADFSDFDTEDITFPYCTEFIVIRENDKDPQLLKDALEKLGDSLVVVSDEEIIKVHVHTDDPGMVLHLAVEYGQFQTTKIENMRIQHTNKVAEGEMAENTNTVKTVTPIAKAQEVLEKYGVVAVAPGDGIADIFTELGVNAIVKGGQTMNPSTEDILSAIELVNAENIFVLPNNKNIILAAQQASALTEKNIIVIPSKTTPQGISAMQAYDTDLEVDDITSGMTAALKTVLTMQITTAVRDSDMGGLNISKDDFIGLFEGELIAGGKNEENLVRDLIGKFKESEKDVITIFYGEEVTDEEAEGIFDLFVDEFTEDNVSMMPGGQSVYRYIISAE